jgi:hypothetical protein
MNQPMTYEEALRKREAERVAAIERLLAGNAKLTPPGEQQGTQPFQGPSKSDVARRKTVG